MDPCNNNNYANPVQFNNSDNSLSEVFELIKQTSKELLNSEDEINKSHIRLLIFHYYVENIMLFKTSSGDEYMLFATELDQKVTLLRYKLYNELNQLFVLVKGKSINDVMLDEYRGIYPQIMEIFQKSFPDLVKKTQPDTKEVNAETIFSSLLMLAEFHLWKIEPVHPHDFQERLINKDKELDLHEAVEEGINKNYIRYIRMKEGAQKLVTSYLSLTLHLSKEMNPSQINLKELEAVCSAFTFAAISFSDLALCEPVDMEPFKRPMNSIEDLNAQLNRKRLLEMTEPETLSSRSSQKQKSNKDF